MMGMRGGWAVKSQIEEYEYARNPISPSFGMAAYFQADTGNGDEEPEEEGNRAVRFIRIPVFRRRGMTTTLPYQYPRSVIYGR